MNYIREYTQQKWNRFVPVTAAVVDIPSSYDNLMKNLHVDIFSSNAGYRGYDFQVTQYWIIQLVNKPIRISGVEIEPQDSVDSLI